MDWLFVAYVLGIFANLLANVQFFLQEDLEWKRYNAASVLLSFVWPVTVVIVLVDTFILKGKLFEIR